MSSVNTLTILPVELQQYILSFVRDPGITSLVCQTWCELGRTQIFHKIILSTVHTFVGDAVFEQMCREFVKVPDSHSRSLERVKQLFLGVYGEVKKFPGGPAYLESIRDKTINEFFNPAYLLIAYEHLEILEMRTYPENFLRFGAQAEAAFMQSQAMVGDMELEEGSDEEEVEVEEIEMIDIQESALQDFDKSFTSFRTECAEQVSRRLFEYEIHKNVNELDLTSILCSNKLPRTIGRFCHLTSLNLSQNDLENLPQQIGCLSALVELNIGTNKFTEFPGVITELVKLQYLNARNNQLTELSKAIGNLTDLEMLNLFGNPLKRIPQEIFALPKLTYLFLGQGSVPLRWKRSNADQMPEDDFYLGGTLEDFLKMNGIEIYS